MQIQKKYLILVIILACFAAYLNSLSAKFVWDDGPLIIENPYVKSIKYIPLYFIQDIWNICTQNMPSGYYRPFLSLFFMVDYHLWKMNPFGYHLTNLILHMLVCISVFGLVQKLFRETKIAFFSALLFAVHPMHTESVTFICAGVDLVCLLFMLGSVFLFLKYLDNRKIVFYLISLVLFMAALLTKEMAIMLPILIIGIDYLCLSKQKIKNILNHTLALHLGFFVVISIYILLRYIFIGWEFMYLKHLSFSNFTYGTDPFWRFYTVLKVLAYYVGLLFFPYALNADHFFLAANSIFELPVIAGLLLVLTSVYLAIRNIKKNPILTFSIFFFFVMYFPISNIIPSGNIFAERYIYIPSIGFCIAVAFGFVKLSRAPVKTKYLNWEKSVFIVFTLIILIFIRATFERNEVWRNEFTLWYETAKASPKSGRAHLNLGNVYNQVNMLDKALEEFNTVLRVSVDPRWYHYAINNAGYVYLKKGLLDEAIESFKIALSMDPDTAMTHNNLAIAYGKKGRFKESIQEALIALEKNKYLYFAHYNLALGYFHTGKTKESIREFELYLDVVPTDFSAHIDLGRLYYGQGDLESARKQWLFSQRISGGSQVVKELLKQLENK